MISKMPICEMTLRGAFKPDRSMVDRLSPIDPLSASAESVDARSKPQRNQTRLGLRRDLELASFSSAPSDAASQERPSRQRDRFRNFATSTREIHVAVAKVLDFRTRIAPRGCPIAKIDLVAVGVTSRTRSRLRMKTTRVGFERGSTSGL
jgi:hypothetical protein